MTIASSSSVRVAVRVRPITEQEKQHYQNNVISFIPDNQQQIILDGDRPFTFDYVYPPTCTQEQVYSTCVIPLLNKFMEGYNSTILAYGQTGSGKTYSMGIGLDTTSLLTNNTNDTNHHQQGIVPRFIHSLFQSLAKKQQENAKYTYQVCVSFLELHNEDLVDLLCPTTNSVNNKKRDFFHQTANLTIREDVHGNICWSGVREEQVSSPRELLGLLQKGSIARTTASTDMNNTSSRSHAIFSIILKQSIPSTTSLSPPITDIEQHQDEDIKRLVSKFHFVDLAGSERLKRTNAVGDRAKEGISINAGLLALGNVISALGDESRRVSHIPYRDSKLTRLLQDSLGGNSQTLMLACASPADANLTETLNTLKYANRARNIRNRVVINQTVCESDRLKAVITRLKEELRGSDDFLCAVNDEMDSLKMEVGVLNGVVSGMKKELAVAKYERDVYRNKLNLEMGGGTDADLILQQQQINTDGALVQEYANTIESLRVELAQAQQKLKIQQDQNTMYLANSSSNSSSNHIQIDRMDSSATLVGSSSPSVDSMHNDKSMTTTIPMTPDSKKLRKKHSYRFGSKRSKSIRRRSITSINSSSNTASPKQINHGIIRTSNSDEKKILLDAKRKMQQEREFLQSAKISIATSNKNHTIFNGKNMNESVPNPKMLQYRRRTVDISSPISVASALQTDQLNETNRLIQKLSSAIESKHLLISQLEKSEALHANQLVLLNRKITDLTHKKQSAHTQSKQDLTELRNSYELRLKKHQHEMQTLRRKHTQLITKSDTMRNSHQSAIDTLHKSIDKLTHEKKKLMKRIKLESDRAREKHAEYDRDIAKIKRQEVQWVSAKKRLERELGVQKANSKRSAEEIVALGGQMKQIGLIIKKVMSMQQQTSRLGGGDKKGTVVKSQNGALTEKNLLAKAAACANVRGYLIRQSAIKRAVGGGIGGKFNVTTLQQHVVQKKKLIHRAIAQYVYRQGGGATKMYNALLQKKYRLVQEQKELLSERHLVIQEEIKLKPDTTISLLEQEPQYMDERIDMITVELDTIHQHIEQIENISCLNNNNDDCYFPHEETEVDKDNNWQDIIDKELSLFDAQQDCQVAYETALSLIRTLEPEEARLVAESLMQDIIQLKTDSQVSHVSVIHLTQVVHTLQLTLVQMRRGRGGEMGVCTGNVSDSLLVKSLKGPVNIQSGLVLPKA